MKRTKERNLSNKILAVVLSAVFFCTALSTAVFAVNGDDDSSTDTSPSTTSSSDVENGSSETSSTPSDSSDTSSESSDTSSDSSDTSSDSSDTSSESSSNTSNTSDNSAQTTSGSSSTQPTTPTQPAVPNPNALAVGTKFTVGNFMYMVTGANTVSLKGFAKNVSSSTVQVKNTITYNGATYNVTKIGTEAFKGENGIKKVIMSKNITDVGKRSFYKCKNLNKVRIKYNVKIIRKGAFRYCSNLKTINITSTVLNDIGVNALKSIKSGAVVNVMNDPVRKLVKTAVPSNVTVNMM